MQTIIASERRSPSQRLRFAQQKYIAVLRVSIANNLAYIMEVVFRAFSLIVLVFILGQLKTGGHEDRPSHAVLASALYFA